MDSTALTPRKTHAGRSISSRGSATREAILHQGVALAREVGISGLSIGGLADAVGMSKSGLFAHFGSKEELQIAVLEAAQDDFTDNVLKPAFTEPRGLTRLRAVMRGWLRWSTGNGEEAAGGCVVLAASHEFDDRPGVVRDYLLLVETNLQTMLHRSIRHCIETGELPSETHVEQFAFELMGLVMSGHFHVRLMRDPRATPYALAALERLIATPPLLHTEIATPVMG
ncbi:MAG: TetR/AcrR family transcriptional regulator [Burkholderiales bacterium]|nr:TetR/AcrR family transcriptional regulator [Burkholderiales bacterium]